MYLHSKSIRLTRLECVKLVSPTWFSVPVLMRAVVRRFVQKKNVIQWEGRNE